MNINVFGKYKITIKGSYSYQNEDGDFITEDVDKEFCDNGFDLIPRIKRKLADADLIDFGVKENKFYFEYFNPLNGESSDYEWTIEEILEECK